MNRKIFKKIVVFIIVLVFFLVVLRFIETRHLLKKTPAQAKTSSITWQTFNYQGDFWMRSFDKAGQGLFDYKLGGGGSITQMRYVPNNYEALLAPSFASETTDRVIQAVLWANNVMGNSNLQDKRWNINQAGDGSGGYSKVIKITDQGSVTDVWAVADQQWQAPHQKDFAGSDPIVMLTRYERLNNGVLRIRKVVLLPKIKNDGADQNSVNFYYENWTPFLEDTSGKGGFSAIALGIDKQGQPNSWYRANSNIPYYPNKLSNTTSGYVVLYKENQPASSRVVSVVYSKQTVQKFDTSAQPISVLNLFDFSSGIAILPGIHINNTEGGSVLDMEIRLVPGTGSDADYRSLLDAEVSDISRPKVYGPNYKFSGDLATIVEQLRQNLNNAPSQGTRTEHLAELINH